MNNLQKAIERCLELDGKAHKPRWWIGHISEQKENAGDIDSEDGAICDNVYTNYNRSLIIEYRTLCPKFAKALKTCITALDSIYKHGFDGNTHNAQAYDAHDALSEIEKIFLETKG